MTNREYFKEAFGFQPNYSLCTMVSCEGTICRECHLYKKNWGSEYCKPPKKVQIKVGDKVKIIDYEEQYTTYNALFNKSTLSKEVISNFNRGVSLSDLSTYASSIYQVLEILEHENFDGVYIAIIQDIYDNIYLIGVDGLEVI